MSDPPLTELEQEAQDCRALLGVHDDWRVSIKEVDHPNNDTATDGTCHLETMYLRARIEIRRGLTPARRREVVLHEVFHVAMAHMDAMAQRITELLPEELQAHAAKLYQIAEEQTIERMTRAITATIRPTPPQEG